ncbi:MAG: glycosyl hydrolase 53 family protein [Ferruginibacter sp.]
MRNFIQLCFNILFIAALSCKSSSSTTPTPEPPVVVPFQFAKGADVSWITQMEATGRKFYNAAGVETEAIALMKSLGMNTIRIRVWVNPSAGYNNLADVLAKATRAKNLGMRIMINFHYSDTWADPGSQTKPIAWASQSIAALKTSLANHTRSVLAQLKANGITPEWVQVGNETNDGMLWPDGRATVSMYNFAQLINAGYDAVKAEFPKAKVIVHISNGYDNGLFRWIFEGLRNNNAKYDVIGMSLYPEPNNWATQNFLCLTNMNDMVTTFNKEVMIVEVGMSWDSYNQCKDFLTDLIAKTKSVANNKVLGVLYWEPQSYNNWQGYTKGAFDNNGKPTVAMSAFAN